MARHRIGVLGRRETPATTTDLEADQARVRRRVEALESGGTSSLVADGGTLCSGESSDSSVTASAEATDEDVAAAVRALEAHGHRILSSEHYRR